MATPNKMKTDLSNGRKGGNLTQRSAAKLTKNLNNPKADPIEEGSTISVIAPGKSDVVLQIKHEFPTRTATHSFAVASTVLLPSSAYFDRLFSPGRFGEGERLHSAHAALCEKHGTMWREAVSKEALPVVQIEDLGRIANVNSIVPLLEDFFRVLHGLALSSSQPPPANLANLAIVADRFDALEAVRDHVERKKIIRMLDNKTTPKIEASLTEQRVRQRLLVGLLLDYPPWVEKYSAKVVVKGWVPRDAEVDSPLWWDLPGRVEEELALRRDCVLETLRSMQDWFVGLYLSRARQCKLGYHNSTECDSFQLGEMVRFFHRISTLSIKATIVCGEDSEDLEPSTYEGDLNLLIDSFRQIPEYQIDANHSHCGIRTRILPLLDLVQECLYYLGICGRCWKEDRAGYAWMGAKKPLVWQAVKFRPKADGCQHRHLPIRDMFLATERKWD
ncbi:hypothetical protein K431DRAFT_335754 [Polychaeton citri CBS 116435]|uniref:BTB domain-containing protein n=1 Tax=Polychaeton citri CBS 116435 TaxID=1314669 RepID=A0A9P4QK36_9PEZI|nr:hypothetical protein K431DRAFT_335754 [Polychaeton citri CBS 116435]